MDRLRSSLQRTSRAISVVCLTLTLAACGEGPRPASPDGMMGDGGTEESLPALPAVEVVGGPTVVFLGDSITAGLHLPAERAFPALLQRRLAAEGLPFQLVNAGVSGDTTAAGLARVDWILRSEPELVVLALGANDLLRGQPAENAEANLRAILARLDEAGVEVLLLGYRLPPNFGALTEAYDGLYPSLAEETGVDFVPFFMRDVAGVEELNFPDQLHPKARGHELLADNVAPALRAALTRLAERSMDAAR